MRVLFLHPEDSPWGGAWCRLHWDLIVDLGFASPYTYEEWSRRSGARVLSIYQFAGQTESYRWVNKVLEHGRGRLLDRMGLDWWEILAVTSYHDLQALYLLDQLRPEIAAHQIELAAAAVGHVQEDLGLSGALFSGRQSWSRAKRLAYAAVRTKVAPRAGR